MDQAPLPSGDEPTGVSPAVAEPAPDWPPWFAFVGFLAALLCTLTAVGVILAVAGIDTDDDGSATLTIVATLVQGVFFVGVALVFARSVTSPRPWHFGLRRAPLWRTVGWAALGMLAFYVLTAVYSVIVQPDVEQDVVDSLGAGESTAGLIAAGAMVMIVAPFVEELFFRGFFYRALRTRYPLIVAALVDGLVFGLIHFDFEGADGLLLIPPLGFLGFIFCLVYERTGTLWAVVGMHAFNNAVAFAAQASDHDGWEVAVVFGPLMLLVCFAAPRYLPSGPPPLPPPRELAGRPDAQLSLPSQ